MMHVDVVAPSVQLVVWTLAATATFALLAVVGLRWLLSRRPAVTPRVGLALALLLPVVVLGLAGLVLSACLAAAGGFARLRGVSRPGSASG